MVPTDPDHSPAEIADTIHNLGVAARITLADAPVGQNDFRNVRPVDAQKFDLKLDA